MLIKGSPTPPRPRGAILLIQLGDIGDVVLSMPTIRALRAHFPKNRIWVAVRDKARELIEDCPWVDGTISIHKKRRGWLKGLIYQVAFIKHLKTHRFDWAIEIRTGTRGAFLAFLSGAKIRIGRYSGDEGVWRNAIFTHLVRPTDETEQYAARHALNILSPFGITTSDPIPFLNVTEDRRQRVLYLLSQYEINKARPIICLHPFSLWAYKEWHPEKWSRLIRFIRENYGCEIVLTGSPDDRKRAEDLIMQYHITAHNLAGTTSVGDLPALIEKAAMVIGVDTAVLHIAAAVGTPTIGIFGPSSTDVWAARGSGHVVITKGLDCQPCRRKGCDDSDRSRCLDELTWEEAIPPIQRQLEHLLFGNRSMLK